MPIQDVVSHVDSLETLHKELLALAEQKKQALIDNDIEKLSGIVARETRLAKAIGEQEQAWKAAARRYVEEQGFQAAPGMTMSDLIRFVHKTEDRQQLSEARQRLLGVIDKLKEANALNQQLLENALALVNHYLDLFVGPAEDEATYRPPTVQKKQEQRRGYFDTKA